jgi:hypothetical protein
VVRFAVVLVALFGYLTASAYARPTPVVTVDPNPAVQGQQTTFDGSGSYCDAAPCRYRWTDPDDGQVYATTVSFSYAFQSLGTHRVALTVTNAYSRSSSITQSFDVVAASPTPTPTPSPTATPTPTSTPTPTPSPTATPTPPPAANGCMPDPSSCGYPDLDGLDPVGVTPGTALTPVNSYVVLSTPGQVYENKQVTGQIRVSADNVTIRNVKLIATDAYYGIISQGRGLTVSHVEVDHQGRLGDGSGGDFYGIGTQNYSADHVYLHNGSDCAGMSGVGVAVNVSITNSLCAVGIDADSDGWPDGGTFDGGGQHQSNGALPPSPATPSYCYSGGGQHFDGFQSDGGQNITLRHNVIRNPCSQTSAIIMSSDTASISNATIDDNLIAGGGWTLYCAGVDNTSSVSNMNVTGNRVARTYWTQGGYYGPDARCGVGYADTWSANVWDEDGSPLPRNG